MALEVENEVDPRKPLSLFLSIKLQGTMHGSKAQDTFFITRFLSYSRKQ